MTPLSIRSRTSPCGPILELVGDLDFGSARALRDVLPELAMGPGQQLIVDLRGLTLCDSSGIGALIAARNQAVAADATIALAEVPEAVGRVLGISGLNGIFPVHSTVEAAQAAWPPRTG